MVAIIFKVTIPFLEVKLLLENLFTIKIINKKSRADFSTLGGCTFKITKDKYH